MKIERVGITAFLMMVLLQSCITYEDLILFRKEGAIPQLPSDSVSAISDLRVQSGDLISIRVKGFDEILVAPFNLISSQNAGGAVNLMSYLVSTDGTISFPNIGVIKVGGMTIPEVEKAISNALEKYIQEPTVIAQIINFRVTVLGEVSRPGTFNASSNRVTIFEALGNSGDLTIFSDRENVLVIRDIDGKRTYGRVNLQSPDVFKSPYYYLRQNDVIYVDPLSKKVSAVRQPATNYLPFVSTILSTLTVIISLSRL